MKTIIFGRISTSGQDWTRQLSDLQAFAKQRGDTVEKVFTEQQSGAKKSTTDPVFVSMMDYCKLNEIKRIYVTELSRIGRSQIEVLKSIKLLRDNQICVHIQTFNIETLNPDGTLNVLGELLIGILSAVAQLERSTLMGRLKSGYRAHRAKNGRVGRKQGLRVPDNVKLTNHSDIVRYLKQGLSVRQIAGLTKKSGSTVQMVNGIMEGRGKGGRGQVRTVYNDHK